MSFGQQQPWTDDEIALLRQLWSDGFTSGQIAARMGRSRSCIMGAVRRYGLPGRPGARTGGARPNTGRRRVATSAPAPVGVGTKVARIREGLDRTLASLHAPEARELVRASGDHMAAALQEVAAAAAPELDAMAARIVAIVNRRTPLKLDVPARPACATCQWPLDPVAGRRVRYCGEPVTAHRSQYCEDHRLTATVPTKPMRLDAHR
ncbi:GcrA family cell cycle regulator [Rhizosaccharibacter radicis]|uniref:GcrA cell cycle regulator n=1 Tax=Rhizosaccharibacter radicis TaxID=2782605 RepID=A0ABT1VYU5_9PROT|nr:hypothetical protein [Acetobacteraceae bacterium KSS12]